MKLEPSIGGAAALFVCALLLASPSSAASEWQFCGLGLQIPARPAAEVEDADPEAAHVSADSAEVQEEGLSVLKGNVQVLHGTQQLHADLVTLTQPEQILDAEGHIRYWDDGVYATGDKAHLELATDQASLEHSQFILRDEHARGEAKFVSVRGQHLALIDGAVFTTCDPADEDWVLRAEHIELDRIEEWGSARSVIIEFQGVPVFYSPYLSFPLSDKRKSGFLTPGYRVSGQTGFELQVPYYWNIAPEQDATLTARGMTRRGVLLEGEYRYLQEWGEGEVGLEYLPHDAVRGDDRAAFSFQHDGYFTPHWHTDVDVDWVSDKEYFEELGTNLEIASRTFLERRADVYYSANRIWAFARVQDWQTLDRNIAGVNRPYKRLPQLRLYTGTPAGNRRVTLEFDGEIVYFDRRDSVTGARLDLKPYVSYPMRNAWSFLEPKLTLNYTSYYLDNVTSGAAGGAEQAFDSDPSRFIPTFSTDAGIYLDRDFTFGSRRYVQTLEPRLFYLFVPFQDQDDLPVFDTGEYTFSFAQLFREDRFSGADRVADANQLALALTTRVLAPRTGEELLRASVGQIRFFRDRRTRLVGDERETEAGSDIVAEVGARIADSWRVAAGFQWNTRDSRTDRNTFRVRYQPDPQRVVNLEYRFVRDTVEQTDLSFRWPVGRQWGAVGRWNFSIPEKRTLEIFGGLEYDTCCWAGRVVVRRYLRNTLGEFDTGVFLQLELKGLAGVGERTAAFLQRSIPGYQNTF